MVLSNIFKALEVEDLYKFNNIYFLKEIFLLKHYVLPKVYLTIFNYAHYIFQLCLKVFFFLFIDIKVKSFLQHKQHLL